MIPWFQFTTINIGPIPIQVWGLFVSLGIILATVIIWKKAEQKHIDRDLVLDIIIIALLFGLIFSRLFHIVFYKPVYYLQNPLTVLQVWLGGFSSYGAFFGAALGFIYIYKKRSIKKSSLPKMLDLFAFGSIYGWIVGRIGCFMIHDHLGKHTDMWLSIATPSGSRFEMALLEIIALIPLAILFFVYRKKEVFSGWFFSVLVIYYGILRFVLDFFRASDIVNADARYLGLTPAQYFSVVLVGLGVHFFLKFRKQKK
ncbi:MAG: hypothetical protein GF349_02875 [Candidatus Magasanikbacteria bacterium]|nr:hypothetical protein [Candidatus Magasanikbacteria bacterium]